MSQGPQEQIHPAIISQKRVNGVEILIFCVVAGMFGNSLYQLFYGWGGTKTLTAMISDEQVELGISTATLERGPASLTQSSSAPIDIDCEKVISKKTSFERIRLMGTLCAPQGGQHPASTVVRAEILNMTTKFNAIVFSDTIAGKFSTDDIPLAVGANHVTVTYLLTNGKVLSQEVSLMRETEIAQ